MIDKNTLRRELFQTTVGTLDRRNDFAGRRGLENSDSTG